MPDTTEPTDDPFVRVLKMLEPLKLPDDMPLRDCLPGLWPTIGDLRLAAQRLERGSEGLREKMAAIQTLAEGGSQVPWNNHQGVFEAIARIARAALSAPPRDEKER